MRQVARRRQQVSPKRRGIVQLAGVVCSGLPLLASAQETSELLTTQLPYPAYQPTQDDHYFLKAGALRLRYDVSLSAIFTDNRNYTEDDKDEDFGLLPMLNVGLFYPISDRQKLQVDVGIGYQWWANTDEQNRLYIAPNSHLDYAFEICEVQMRLSNITSTSAEASDRAEFAGEDSVSTDVAFNRISNTTALTANWAASSRLSFTGGYAFELSRSLNDQFTRLDRDTHLFSGSTLYRIGAPLWAGISASYTKFKYTEDIQNDGDAWSIGPTVTWLPSETLRLNAYVHYSESTYETTGVVADAQDFSGVTFGVSATHNLNRYLTQSASFARQVEPGFESNFTDSYTASYALLARLSSRLNSNLNFEYRSADTSDDFENADLFGVSIGAGYRLLARATLGLTYSLNTRVSDQPNRGYWENRVLATASYRF